MFKVEDSVVCIDDSIILRMDGGYRECHLSVGKVYKIKSTTPTDDDKISVVIYIDNDNGLRKGYSIKRFMSLIKYRKLKLKKICSKLKIKNQNYLVN